MHGRYNRQGRKSGARGVTLSPCKHSRRIEDWLLSGLLRKIKPDGNAGARNGKTTHETVSWAQSALWRK